MVDMPTNPSPDQSMNIQVSGRHMDLGEALRTRVAVDLEAAIGKYFDRGGSGEVRFGRDGHSVCCDAVILLASGQQLVVRAAGADAHSAFDAALGKLETRVRRYKKALNNHHPHNGGPRGPAESAPLLVLRSADGDDDDTYDEEWGSDGSAGAGAPAGAIIAETTASVRTQTVAMAVMELDLSEAPVVLFRNVSHGGLSVVYRRLDGNVGWIDPERTRAGALPEGAGARIGGGARAASA